MCVVHGTVIEFRYIHGQRRRWGRGEGQSERERQTEREREREREPVSYTHLTLPTKHGV